MPTKSFRGTICNVQPIIYLLWFCLHTGRDCHFFEITNRLTCKLLINDLTCYRNEVHLAYISGKHVNEECMDCMTSFYQIDKIHKGLHIFSEVKTLSILKICQHCEISKSSPNEWYSIISFSRRQRERPSWYVKNKCPCYKNRDPTVLIANSHWDRTPASQIDYIKAFTIHMPRSYISDGDRLYWR